MIRKIIFLIVILLGLLTIYEAYAVGRAYQILFNQFSPYSSVSLEELGLNEKRQSILIKVQDPNFYHHSGIEWPSPLTSTTITQSVTKKLFFKKFTKGFKKIEQTLIARFIVNPNISKKIQLAAFVSTAYFGSDQGNQSISFKQGALTWFNKPLSELNDDEYIALIAMLPSPNTLKPSTKASIERVSRIKKMLRGDCRYDHVSKIYLHQCS